MKYFLSLIFAFIIINSSYAQDSCNTDNYELKHGVEFQIRSLSLTNYNGYTFAYRYLFDKDRGLRIGVLTNLRNEDNDGTTQIDTIKYDTSTEESRYDFKISLQYLGTILRHKEFSLIYGCGPFLSYYNQETISTSLNSPYTIHYKTLNKSFGYGLDLLLGVEYHLAENVLLSGEYGIAMKMENLDYERIENFNYNDDRPDRINEQKENGTRYSITGIGVNLGLSVFF